MKPAAVGDKVWVVRGDYHTSAEVIEVHSGMSPLYKLKTDRGWEFHTTEIWENELGAINHLIRAASLAIRDARLRKRQLLEDAKFERAAARLSMTAN